MDQVTTEERKQIATLNEELRKIVGDGVTSFGGLKVSRVRVIPGGVELSLDLTIKIGKPPTTDQKTEIKELLGKLGVGYSYLSHLIRSLTLGETWDDITEAGAGELISSLKREIDNKPVTSEDK